MESLEITKVKCVLIDRSAYSTGESFSTIRISKTIVEFCYDGKLGWSEWRESTHLLDMIPGGTLYLGDTFEEAVKKLEIIYG